MRGRKPGYFAFARNGSQQLRQIEHKVALGILVLLSLNAHPFMLHHS